MELIVNQIAQLYDKKDYSWDYKAFPIVTAGWYFCNFLKNRTDELLWVSSKIHPAISKTSTGVSAKQRRDNLKPYPIHVFSHRVDIRCLKKRANEDLGRSTFLLFGKKADKRASCYSEGQNWTFIDRQTSPWEVIHCCAQHKHKIYKSFKYWIKPYLRYYK